MLMMPLLLYRRRSRCNERPTHQVRRVLSDNAGLTMLETIVALAILSIGIVAVLHAFSTSLAATKEAESYSTAAMLANEIATQLDNQADNTAGQQSGTFEDAGNYSWEAEIEQPDSNELMRTDITVKWMAGNNPRQYEMVIFLKPSTATSTTTSTSGDSS